jgi:hypothetical protein
LIIVAHHPTMLHSIINQAHDTETWPATFIDVRIKVVLGVNSVCFKRILSSADNKNVICKDFDTSIPGVFYFEVQDMIST